MRNTFGTLFTLTTFGESHGEAIGGVVDGMPAGIDIDLEFIQSELSRRRPGQSHITTQRNEQDQVELLSGVFEGKSTGCPIGFIVRNTNRVLPTTTTCATSTDRRTPTIRTPQNTAYATIVAVDARRHASLSAVVWAEHLAKLALRQLGVNINAYTSQVGDVVLDRDYTKYDFAETERNPVRCPDPIAAQRMEQLISEVKAEGDTIGGVVTCVVKNCPKGIGEPEFGKLHAMLGAAMLSINAAKGFEYGEGFSCATSRGSRQNDAFVAEGGNIHTSTNHSGGIQGGISNGEDIYFRTAFKPTATILQEPENRRFYWQFGHFAGSRTPRPVRCSARCAYRRSDDCNGNLGLYYAE